MLPLIASLVPLMIGAALLPTWTSVIILLLDTPRGQAKAKAFIGGVTAVRLFQGFGAGGLMYRMQDLKSRFDLSALPPAILTLAGIGLVCAGVFGLLRHKPADAAPPRWFGIVKGAGIVKCGLTGATLCLLSPRQWIFTVGAVAMIRSADVGLINEAIAFVVFTMGAQSMIMAPVVMERMKKDTQETVFDRFASYVSRNGGRIVGAVSLLIGAYLLWHGVTDLAAR